MYPDSDQGYFGIFVRNINENIKLSFEVDEVLIKGRPKNVILKSYKYFIFYFKVFYSLWFKKYKTIYVHFPPYSLPPILFFPFLRKKNLVLNFHGSDILIKSRLNSLFLKYFKLIRSNVKLIVAPSNFLEIEISKKLKFNLIYTSPSGGIPDSYYEEMRECKTNKSRKLKFVYISSLIPSKGIYELLEAAQIMYLNNQITLDLTIFGSGNVDLIKRQVSQFEHIKVLGVAEHKFLSSILMDYDVLIFPSKRESLGLIGLEALACGVPVIASDIPGVNSYIINGHNGLLFELNNTLDLINKIEFLINHPKELERLQLNARKSVLAFKRSIVASNLNKKISEII